MEKKQKFELVKTIFLLKLVYYDSTKLRKLRSFHSPDQILCKRDEKNYLVVKSSQYAY